MTAELGNRIDLIDPRLWNLLLLAILVLLPVTHAGVRRLLLALFYLLAIGVLLGTAALAAAVGLVTVTMVAARLLGRGTDGTRPGATLPLAVASVAVLVLLLVHKLPIDTLAWLVPGAVPGTDGPVADMGETVRAALTALGFSYVALRMIDLLRTVAAGRKPPPTWIDAACYLLPLHMLAAGPIQAYEAFANQPPAPPRLDARGALDACERIVRGLFKSYVLASLVKQVLLTGFAADGAYFWLEVQLHYLWVYLDFSAYSDIAVGVGMLLGVATPENFDRPLTARNLTVFWERWHITLSQFLRRNVFLPLQLAWTRKVPRHPLSMAICAFLVTFMACGLWHAPTLVFLLWGLYHGVGLALANLYRERLRRRLGRAGVKRYMAHPGIRLAATVLTFEFVAFSLAFALHPAQVRAMLPF